MDRGKVVKAQAEEEVGEGQQARKKEKGPIKVEQEEGEHKIKKGDDLDLISASKPPPVKLVLGPKGPQGNRAPRPQEEASINVEPPKTEPGPLESFI